MVYIEQQESKVRSVCVSLHLVHPLSDRTTLGMEQGIQQTFPALWSSQPNVLIPVGGTDTAAAFEGAMWAVRKPQGNPS